MTPSPRYRDRLDAGQKLGVALAAYFGVPDLLVLGLPRGGAPVAAEVAKQLRVPLDVVPVQKVALPGQPELAAGAMARVAGTVTTVRVERVLADWQRAVESVRGAAPGAADQAFDDAAAVSLLELIRRDNLYRADRSPLSVSGRTVLVIDDGLATGATMQAALLGLRAQNPTWLVAAAPVSCGPGSEATANLADDVVIPWQDAGLTSVGQAYGNFDQTTDSELRQLLNLP